MSTLKKKFQKIRRSRFSRFWQNIYDFKENIYLTIPRLNKTWSKLWEKRLVLKLKVYRDSTAVKFPKNSMELPNFYFIGLRFVCWCLRYLRSLKPKKVIHCYDLLKKVTGDIQSIVFTVFIFVRKKFISFSDGCEWIERKHFIYFHKY